MYVAPRPLAEDDPLFPARVGVMSAAALIVAHFATPQMPPLAVALPVGLILGLRGAFNPVRVIGMAVGVPALAWGLSFLVALTREIPWLMVLTAFTVFLLGIQIARQQGNPVGMIIALLMVIISSMGLQNRALLDIVRDELTYAGLVGGVLIVLAYALLPPRREDIHIDDPQTAEDSLLAGSVIRALVLTGISFSLYATLPASDMMLAMAALFPVVFPTRGLMLAEARARMLATFLGVLAALPVLAIYAEIPEVSLLAVMFCLTGIGFGWLMIHGARPVLVYQFAVTVMLGTVMTALTSQSAAQATIARIVLTLGGGIAALAATALLEYAWMRLSRRLGTRSEA
ncbi:MAG: FUSC family protein [Rhodobacterales bacterium]|nr:FUSC family protein [Rhodobacterales bacterium]